MASGSCSSSNACDSKKFTSNIWNFFDRIEINLENNKKEIKAKCKICNKLLSGGSNAGTSHLKRHHENCKTKNNVDIRNYMQLGKDESGNLKTFSYDESYCREEMIGYIIRAEQPFNFMETHDFTGTMQRAVNPQFQGCSGNTVKRILIKNFETQKENLKFFFANFEGRICLTSDIWTSLTHSGFLCITAHYIDNEWKLNKRIISFKIINAPHNGKNIASLINDEIIDFGIRDKIFTITLDNASNNDAAVSRLKRYWQIKEDQCKIFHVRCCAHILNLIVKDGLKHVDDTLSKIRGIVAGLNSSQAKHELFFYCCKMLNMKKRNINLDMPTRWNSTYKLLQTITKYRKVVELYEIQLINNDCEADIDVLNDYDWHIADLLRDLFEVFDTSTKKFCGVYYPSSNRVVMQITNIFIVLQKYLNLDIFNDAIFAMIEKFRKYWGEIPLIFYLGLIVDPRLKFEALDEWLTIIYFNDQIKIEEIKNEINSLLYNLYNYYKEKYGDDISSIKLPPTSTSSSSFYKGALEMLKSRKKTTNSSPNNTTDLDRYLNIDLISFEDDEDFDILIWWKSQQHKYPVLSIITRDVLTVPVSTVTSETAFSAGGRVVSDKRCSLAPNSIEANICVKDWAIVDKRIFDSIQEENMFVNMEKLKSSRSSWICDSSPSSPRNND